MKLQTELEIALTKSQLAIAISAILIVSLQFIRSDPAAAAMNCDQCDEMFQTCIAEVDPDAPLGYEVCQVAWDHCKSQCSGTSSLTRVQTRNEVKGAYSRAITPPQTNR